MALVSVKHILAGGSCSRPPLECPCGKVVAFLKDAKFLATSCRYIDLVMQSYDEFTVVNSIYKGVYYYDNGQPYHAWEYTFQYDDTNLSEPIKGVRECDIESYACASDTGITYTKRVLECYCPPLEVVDAAAASTCKKFGSGTIANAYFDGCNLYIEGRATESSLVDIRYLPDVAVFTPTALAAEGSANPTYTEVTITNNTCKRVCGFVEVQASAFATILANQPSKNWVIGHRVYIDGVLQTATDGRNVSGYNHSTENESDTSHGEDFILPIIKHKICLEAGESKKIASEVGYHLGASIHTALDDTQNGNLVNIESRYIAWHLTSGA